MYLTRIFLNAMSFATANMMDTTTGPSEPARRSSQGGQTVLQEVPYISPKNLHPAAKNSPQSYTAPKPPWETHSLWDAQSTSHPRWGSQANPYPWAAHPVGTVARPYNTDYPSRPYIPLEARSDRLDSVDMNGYVVCEISKPPDIRNDLAESGASSDPFVDTGSIARDVSIEYRKKFLQDSASDANTVKSEITRLSTTAESKQKTLIQSKPLPCSAAPDENKVHVAQPKDVSSPIPRSLHKKMLAMDTGLVNHEKKIDHHETKLGMLNGSVASVVQSLNSHDKDLVKVNKRMSEVEKSFKELKMSIAQESAGCDEKLNDRLQKLNKDLDSLRQSHGEALDRLRQDHDALHSDTYETFALMEEHLNPDTTSPEYDAMCEPDEIPYRDVKSKRRKNKNK